jgi:opacity protein-like surface antigen
MKPHSLARLLPLSLGVGVVLVVSAPRTLAQGPDFLFRRPVVDLSVSFGYALPRAGSELFDFTREQLTVDRSDFGAPVVQGEIAVRVNERVSIGVGAGWAGDRTKSEFRDWIGTDNLPIEQTTRFERVPVTVNVKAYLRDRGRSLSRFAWVPARWAPYVGGALGAVWYRFEQEGEFVDYQNLDIFRDFYVSDGWAPTAHLLAGAEVSVATRVALTAEGRYSWGSSELSRDFVDFDDIDLAGFQATAGVALRF